MAIFELLRITGWWVLGGALVVSLGFAIKNRLDEARATSKKEAEEFQGRNRQGCVGAIVVMIGAAVVIFLSVNVRPAIRNETFVANCGTQKGFWDVCMGNKAQLIGEVSDLAADPQLQIGQETISIKFKAGEGSDLVDGQRIEVVGKFAQSDILRVPQVWNARVLKVLTTKEQAAALLAGRRADEERATLARKCPNRLDPQTQAAIGVCNQQGSAGSESLVGSVGCMAQIYEFERKCRAAGY